MSLTIQTISLCNVSNTFYAVIQELSVSVSAISAVVVTTPTYEIFVNTLGSIQNGRHFADHIFLNENVCVSFKISLKIFPKFRINNIPALVQIMAWRRSGDKPLSEPMMLKLLTHICVTRPQGVNGRVCGVYSDSIYPIRWAETPFINII